MSDYVEEAGPPKFDSISSDISSDDFQSTSAQIENDHNEEGIEHNLRSLVFKKREIPLQRPISRAYSYDEQNTSQKQKPNSVIFNRQFSLQNGNMVMQLVIPKEPRVATEEPYVYKTQSLYDEPMNNTFNKVEDSCRPGTAFQQENTSVTYINRAYGKENFVTSNLSNSTFHILNHDTQKEEYTSIPGTTDEEKRKVFRKYLTIILSCIYAVFIVTLGLVVYISDIIIGNTALAETFSIYLLIIGFVYILYLIIDIRIYVNKRRLDNAERVNRAEPPPAPLPLQDHIEYRNGNLHLSIPLPSWSDMLWRREPHHYCFSQGRHSGSFYLKIGAAGFCLGHLIHSGLILSYQVAFLSSDGDAFFECASVATLVLDIMYPIYSFFLLYFIFKYSNVIINRRLEVSRFALMHCIAASLCFWLGTILREITDSLSHHMNGNDPEDSEYDSDEKIAETSSDRSGNLQALPLTTYSKSGARELANFFNGTARLIDSSYCSEDRGANIIYQNFSPYLYPFTVEYSILVVGVLFIIWQNIGGCVTECQMSGNTNTHCSTPGLNKENNFANTLVVHADCHSANTGLFAGILVIVCSIVSIILFFISITNPKFRSQGVIVNNVTNVLFLVLMTVSAIFAYRQITKLDLNYHQISLLDDLLLFICIPAFFVNGIFSIIPAVQNKNPLNIINILLQVLQVLIQTPLIVDGLRRCSNTRQLRLTKPGRGLVTFLVVCNVAMWIIETFEIKSHDMHDDRYAFYGLVSWTIIGHMTIPFIMFYRFHSSVCLVDIWKSAYEASENLE